MHFIKILIHIVIVSILVRSRMCLAYSESDDDMPMELERLLDELTSLKNKLDEWFKRNKNNNQCASGTTDEYFQNVANFLIGNQTTCEENCINKLSGFFKRIKQKIQKVVNMITRKNSSRSTNSTESCAHVRRSVAGSLKLPKNKAKFNQEAENFHQYLTKVINCLQTNKKSEESTSDEDDNFKLSAPMRYETTSPETSDQEEIPNASKVENILKYLADSHHSVEEAGRAGYKPPDLRKTQEIIDSVKSSMIDLNLDDETTSTTTIDPFDFSVLRKRNIFDDFAKKFESKSRKFDGETKTNAKMKENGLFDGMPKIDEDFREMGRSDDYLEREEHQKPIVDEGKMLDQDLTAISSKLDTEQRLVIMNFLDQLNEKPKQFKFDVEPYLQSSLKNILKKSQKVIEESPEVPRKYFDFDYKKKRDAKYRDNIYDDFKMKDASIFNDGSVPTDQIISKYRPKLLLTPHEVEKNFQLEEIFKELHFDEHEPVEKAADIPFYKTEKIIDDEAAEIESGP